MANANNDQLCSNCSTVDLYSLFTGPRYSSGGPNRKKTIAYIGTLKDVLANIQCPLCRLAKHDLYETGYGDPYYLIDGAPVDPGKVQIGLSAERADYGEAMRYASEETKELVATKLRVVCKPTEDCSEEEKFTIPRAHRGPGIQLLSPDSVDPARPLANGYMITTVENSLGLLKAWMKTCCNSHGDTCIRMAQEAEDVSGMQKIRVIDPYERKLVERDLAKTRYAALSYVWESSREEYTKLAHELKAQGNVGEDWSALLPDTIPRIIEESLSVCKTLELPYLWVDLYCVDQHNQARKLADINAMGHIYRSSEITFVAGAGWVNRGLGPSEIDKGSEPALFPHETPFKTAGRQVVESIQGRKYISALDTIGDQLRSSQWITRSWTFQEGHLARRIAFFGWCDITFMCGAGQWKEGQQSGPYGHEASMPGVDMLSSGYYVLACNAWLRSVTWEFADYQSIIMAYTGRDITYELDKLNAISGCLNMIAQRKDMFFHWGLPSRDFHYGLLWNREYDRRRKGFPSWSWAGWITIQQSHIIYPRKGGAGAFVEDGKGGYRFQPSDTDEFEAAGLLISLTERPHVWNKCTHQLAAISFSKSSLTLRISSEVARFSVDILPVVPNPAFSWSKKQPKSYREIPDGFNSATDTTFVWSQDEEYRTPFGRIRLCDGSGNITVYHYPYWYDHWPIAKLIWPSTLCGSTLTWLLRDGIELIKIVEIQILEASEGLRPFHVVMCLGIDRTGSDAGVVSRMGTFCLPKEAWEKAQPRVTTVEMC